MRRGVSDVNGVDIKFPLARGPMLGFFNPLKLCGELPYLNLKSNNGIIPPNVVSFLK